MGVREGGGVMSHTGGPEENPGGNCDKVRTRLRKAFFVIYSQRLYFLIIFLYMVIFITVFY